MRTDYERIFLGSSCFAMGCAAQDAENSLILETSEALGGEFVDCLRADDRPIVRPAGEGAAFYDELCARGILSDANAARGEIHLPAVNLVLNRIALERGLHMLFRTRPITIARTENGFVVTAVCCARLLTFTCRQLIDTRSTDAARIRALDAEARIALGANLQLEGDIGATMGAFTLKRGYRPGEVFAHYPVQQPSAHDREAMLHAFEQRDAAYLQAKLLIVTPAYAVWCKPIREKTENGWFIPGSGFENPVAAWAAGLTEKEALAQ